MKLITIIEIVLVLLVHDASSLPEKLTILVVADGLKNEYISEAVTPNIHSFQSVGVKISGITPIFPSLKYPNIASMLTGVYAENHNVLDSVVFDKEEQRNIFRNESGFWNSTRDIGTLWNLHIGGGNTNVGGVFGFPESRFLFESPVLKSRVSPNLTEEINTTVLPQTEMRIKTKPTLVQGQQEPSSVPTADSSNAGKSLMDFVTNLEALIRSRGEGSNLFATVFLDEPGAAAQAMGPEPEAAKAGIEAFDRAIGEIVKFLDEVELTEIANIVIASTPSYAEVVLKDTFSISKYTKVPFTFTGQSPIMSIRSQEPGGQLQMFADFETMKSDQVGEVIYATHIPDDWHYKMSKYVPDILVMARKGRAFKEDFLQRAAVMNTEYGRKLKDGEDIFNNIYGCSGFETSDSDMQTVLIAKGPAFKKGLSNASGNTTHKVESVDIFSLMCHVLEIEEPAKRNGSIAPFRAYLTNPPDGPSDVKKTIDKVVKYVGNPKHLPVTVSLLIAGIVIFISICCILAARRRHRRLLTAQGFRYSQVRNNRRLSGDPDDTEGLIDEDEFEGDKTELLAANSDSVSPGQRRELARATEDA